MQYDIPLISNNIVVILQTHTSRNIIIQYKVKLVIFVILETSLRFRSYFGSAPCWCEIIYNCGHNYMRS